MAKMIENPPVAMNHRKLIDDDQQQGSRQNSIGKSTEILQEVFRANE